MSSFLRYSNFLANYERIKSVLLNADYCFAIRW